MKKYIKPQLIEEIIELEDIMAVSVGGEASWGDEDSMSIWDLFGLSN